MPREPSPFAFTDDDDASPLPAPPEFVGGRENVPDLLEGDLSDDDVATAEELEAEEPELLEGSVIMEVPRTFRLPPPIPAQLPTGPARPVFVDDGEIALPPRISQKPQSFPFRQLRREPSGLFEPTTPPEPSPTTAGWRSAALRNEAPEDEVVEEVEAEEIVEDEAPAAATPTAPPPRPAAPPPAPVFAFADDDDSAPIAPTASSRYRDPASMFADTDAHAPSSLYADETSAMRPQQNPPTGVFTDDDTDSDTAVMYREDSFADRIEPRPPQPSAAIPVAAIDDDDDAAWTVPPPRTPAPAPFRDDDDGWSPPPGVSASVLPRPDTSAVSAPISADDDWSRPATRPIDDETVAAEPGPVPADDDWSHVSADHRPVSVEPLPADDDDWSRPVASAPITPADDWSHVAADHRPVPAEPPPVTDDDDWSTVSAEHRLPAPEPAADWSHVSADHRPVATEPPPVTDDDDWSSVSAEHRLPAPAPDPQPITDDDDWSSVSAEHRLPAPAPDPQPITDDDWSTVSAEHRLPAPDPQPITDDDWSSVSAEHRLPAPAPDPQPVSDDDWSTVSAPPSQPPVAAAPPPVADDDDSEPPPSREDRPAPPVTAVPFTPPVFTAAVMPPVSDDDEWTPAAAAPPSSAAPVTDDDEWTPAPPSATPPVTDDDEWSPASPSATPPVTDDDEWSPAQSASLRPVDADAPTPATPAFSGAIRVADQGDDDDDEWVPNPPAASPAPLLTTTSARADDDDEWEPQTAKVALAPAPTDLVEAFPLDLWSDPDELIGRDLGRYRLIKPLSRGMASRVYAAESPADERSVALRVLSPTYSPAEPRARQFLHEAQQLTRLRGDNLVEVLDVGHTPDHLSYYAMELLGGDTLSAVVRAEGPLPWADVAAIANQICDALIVAHDRDIIHSDLTSASCLRLRPAADDPLPDGERRRDKIKLLDVGVTPLLSVYRNADGNLALSHGTPPGTAEYMAPEIASGGRPDVHTEIYALGVIMYELLTGRPPFRGDSFLAVLKKQMYDEPVAPHLAVPEQEIPEAFEKIVLQALAKTPADRFADLRALDEALLAARAKEGELRRVTQILALDPTDWDEEGSRNAAAVRPPSAPARAAAEPVPLATFAADLKEKNPELAAKVFDRPAPVVKKTDPRPTPAALPPPTVQLTHLAAPITAPPMAPPQQAPLVVQLPTNNSSSFRTISLIIIGVCVVAFLAMWMTERRTSTKTRTDVADNKKPGPAKTKKKAPTPVVDTPATKPTPAKQVDPPPAKQALPPPSDPAPPPPTKQADPPPSDPPPPPPTKQVEPPPTEQVEPPPTKKPTPPPPSDGRPERIEPSRFKSKLTSLDARAKSSCAAKSGMKDPRGIRVIVNVKVSPKGAAKVSATGAWANTPLGTCIEQVLAPQLNFNETRTGGTYKHAINF